MGCDCASLWIGAELGPVERACLRSVLRQGHSVDLYCYREPQGVPKGVRLRDAAEIVPEARIVRHRGGSVALFSNLFRYELLRRGRGTWIDCDMYLVAPLDGEAEDLFGAERLGVLGTGVLRLRPDSPLLPPLIALFDEASVPPWLPWRDRLSACARLRLTGRSGLELMPWGSAGPKALTALASEYGMLDLALPPEVFNPVPWQNAGWIRDPAVALEDVVTERTVAVHLWNERIRPFKVAPAPPRSFLARLQREGA